MPDVPYGFDRADGLDGRLGTATPEGSIQVQSTTGVINIDEMPLEELPDSPEVERAEQATITHTYRTSWSEGLNYIGFLGRGVVVSDSFDNVYLILSSSLRHEQGGTALLTIVMEAKSFDPPPEEFSVVPVELGVNIMKHPRYFYAFFGDGYGSTTEQQNQMVIRLLQDYFENTSANYRDAIIRMLKTSIPYPDGDGYSPQPPEWDRAAEDYVDSDTAFVQGTAMAKRAALEIVQKYWRGEETPYVVGYEVTWSQYVFVPPDINPGGFVENPMTEANPQLPAYFFSDTEPPDPANTIFDFLSTWNPQCYSVNGLPGGTINISWLRKSDQVEYQRTWFRITRTWIGSPVGFWDEQLYTRDQRPQVSGDYQEINTA